MKNANKKNQSTKTTTNTNKKGTNKMDKVTPKELTAEQKTQLEELNKQVLSNLTKNYELGKILRQVKALLAGTSEKFGQYCMKHFKLAHSQVNRLMDYAKIRDNIGMGDENVYIPENTLRGMSKFPAATQLKIWEKAKKIADGKVVPSSAHVAEACRKFTHLAKKANHHNDTAKEFHSRTLKMNINLEKENVVDVVKKAKDVAGIKAVIKEIMGRVEMKETEQRAICELIKKAAEAEVMALMNPESNNRKNEEKAA